MAQDQSERTLELLVHRALDNAVENGYEADILNQTPEETALDLADCDAELEGADPDVLRVHTMSWLKSKGVA